MNSTWKICTPDPDKVEHLRQRLQCHPATAAVLVNRCIETPVAAADFLNPRLAALQSPFAVKDIQIAAERLGRAVENRERIMVFGDYDVDGTTATAVLAKFLTTAGAQVLPYVPHRIKEGYGLQPSHVTHLARPKGIRLIVTVDCGSNSHAAIQAARRENIDVIVTDHHHFGAGIPPALALVNPRRPDCRAGFEDLAGVGVAFLLVVCLRKYLRAKGFWRHRTEPNLKSLCDLVALGTIADQVPLRGTNRILARVGIDVLRTGRRPGIRALAAVCNLDPRHISAEDVAFRLAPHINAAGRMAHAGTALSLLVENDAQRCRELALELQRLNQQRKTVEAEMVGQIEAHLERSTRWQHQHALVIAREDWHEGVLGIAAARCARKLGRPAVLIALRNGMGKGSGRSTGGINLFTLLERCAGYLTGFGGHAMAAGLTVHPDNLQQFHSAFEKAAAEAAAETPAAPSRRIDGILSLRDISSQLLDELENLQPCGFGNEEPCFAAHDIRVLSAEWVGKRHRRRMIDDARRPLRHPLAAIQFNAQDDAPFDGMIFRLRWNRWKARQTPQLVVEETCRGQTF